MRSAVLALLVLATIAIARPARADFEDDMVNNWIDNYERNMIEDNVLRGNRPSSGGDAVKSTVVPKRAPRMPAVLAQKAPAAQRAAVEQQLKGLLVAYDRLTVKLKLTERDLAGALALLVCAAYAAYHGHDLPETALVATTKQLHQVLGSDAKLGKLATADKQDLYEQLVIAGMQLFVQNLNAKEGAARDEVRETGRRYLAGFADPDKLEITDRGLAASH